jgi:hypothetical protein
MAGPATGLGSVASGGMSIAVLTIASQFLWHQYQFEMPNESWMAILTIMTGLTDHVSKCRWCQKFFIADQPKETQNGQ